MRTRRPAFTLLEVLLVVLLLGVVLGLAWPNLAAVSRAEALGESGQRLKALVAMCRAQAMNEARRYRIAFRRDGSIRVTRQLDAVKAPHVFVPFRTTWTRDDYLLDDVWVESLLPLPSGPSPIDVADELIEFEEFDDLTPVSDFDDDVSVFFEPDGLSNSLRWTLRDTLGRGVQVTLDGRIGRLIVEPLESSENPERPPPLPDEDEVDVEALTAQYLETGP
jgi:prepilin-type N-terminal cleavage/methylation domain-containing protein